MTTKVTQQNPSMSTQTTNSAGERRFVSPPVDIFENKENIVLVADLPGVAKEDLSIQLNDRELAIMGKRRTQANGEIVSQSIRYEDFRRVFTLHQDLDAERIEAKLRHGVLTVSLPKAHAVKNREVTISAE